MGYYDLILTYSSAEISPSDERLLAHIARTTVDDRHHESDLVRQELDTTADSLIEYRLEFHRLHSNNVWLAIRCRELQWETERKPNRNLPDSSDRFPGSPQRSHRP